MLDIIFAIVWLGIKTCFACIAVYILIIIYLHLRAVSRLNFYEKQGAVSYPGNKRFFFGNTLDLVEYGKVREGSETVCGP